jgi:hypothetical protein
MTRKDYELLAESIRLTRNKAEWQGQAIDESTLLAVSISMAQLLEYDNPRFDRHRFLIACGVHDSTMADVLATAGKEAK